ncbi:MAG TPA: GAF domain-containing protein, partial [Chloroflexia bacterium]|nr:GAF domain-containing protein [Chloroflexia bacterium]
MPDQAAATNSGAQHATPEFLSVFGDAAVLGWSLRIRWLMAAAILGVGALLTLVAALSAEMLLGLVVLAAVVGAYNLLFTVLLHLAPLWDSPRALRRLRWLQVPPDVVIFTIALHLSGGIRTPLPILYAYFIVVSIVMAPRGGTYVAAGVATLCYSVLVLLEATVLPPPANPLLAGPPLVEPPLAYVFDLLTRCGAFWIVAFVADMLSRRIQAGEGLIHRQLEDLTLLYRFSDNLSTAPTLDKALDYIVYELGTLLKVDSCSLMLMNEHGQAEFRAAMGIAPAALAAYREHPLDKRNPLLAAVLSGGSGVFAPDVDAVDGLRAALIRPDTRSFYSFPLRAEDKIVGLLNLSFNRSLTLQPSTYDLIVACSRQAGMAIERTLLYQDAHRSAREMRSLYDIGLATSSSLEINSVLDQIADQVQAVLAPDSLVLVLYDAEKGLLEYVIQRDQGTEYPREILPLNEVGASGWIVRNQKPLLIRKWDQEVPALGFVPSTLGDVIPFWRRTPPASWRRRSICRRSSDISWPGSCSARRVSGRSPN